MTLGALIFDVDGTLAETEEAHRAAFNDTFAAQRVPWHWTRANYRRLLKTTGGKERMQAHQAIFDGHPPLNAAQIVDLHRDKTERYARILAGGGLSLRPGVADLIAATALRLPSPPPPTPPTSKRCASAAGANRRPKYSMRLRQATWWPRRSPPRMCI